MVSPTSVRGGDDHGRGVIASAATMSGTPVIAAISGTPLKAYKRLTFYRHRRLRKYQDNSTFEIRDGFFGPFITVGLLKMMAETRGADFKGKHHISITPDSIAVSVVSRTEYLFNITLDRRTSLMHHGNDSPVQCSVLGRF
jgi:hypothetical protein